MESKIKNILNKTHKTPKTETTRKILTQDKCNPNMSMKMQLPKLLSIVNLCSKTPLLLLIWSMR